GISVRLLSSIFVEVDTGAGVTLQYDPQGGRLYVSAEPRLQGLTRGLCGNYDRNLANDFMSPNQLVENVPALFGNSWAASPHCKNEENDIVVDPCHTNFQSRNFAHEGCSILTSTLFSACHLELDPAPFERQCRFEACAGADAERSLCSSVAHYAFLCQRAGISRQLQAQDACQVW
ncbi:von Willebrand factor-like, partial [Lampetra fluviatilis]